MRFKAMRRRTLAPVLSLVILSCSTAPSAAPHDQIDPDGAFSETALDSELKVIDPQVLGNVAETIVAQLVFEPLLTFDPATLRPAPGAALLPTITPDGLVYHFTLREGLTYSDGTSVRASDYAYGIGRLCDPAVASYYQTTALVISACNPWASLDAATALPDQLLKARRDLFAKGIVVLGDRDLEIHLQQPAAYFPSFLALWVSAPVRQSDVERYGTNWWRDPATYVGNGPFVMVEWVLGSRMAFERNTRYRTPAKLKRLTLSILKDSHDGLAGYQAGTIDRLNGIVGDQLPSIKAAGVDRELVTAPGACTYYVRLNIGRAPLDDPNVRLALAKSIDREAYAREIRGGSAAATSFIPAGLPGHDPSDGAQSYDLAAAKRLIGESKYARTDALRGLVWPIRSDTSATQRREAEWIAAQWQAIGVDVRTELVDPPTLAAANRSIATRRLFLSAGWCADYPDQADWFSFFFTAAAQKGAVDYGYRNASVDQLLNDADRGLDPGKRDELYLRVSRTVSAEVPAIWLAYGGFTSLVKPWVGGLNTNALDFGGVYHPADIFVRPH